MFRKPPKKLSVIDFMHSKESLKEQLTLAESGYRIANDIGDWDKAQAMAMMMMNLCRRPRAGADRGAGQPANCADAMSHAEKLKDP